MTSTTWRGKKTNSMTSVTWIGDRKNNQLQVDNERDSHTTYYMKTAKAPASLNIVS